jgi:hypothetical protein
MGVRFAPGMGILCAQVASNNTPNVQYAALILNSNLLGGDFSG